MNMTLIAANRKSGVGNRESGMAGAFAFPIPHSPFPAPTGAEA